MKNNILVSIILVLVFLVSSCENAYNSKMSLSELYENIDRDRMTYNYNDKKNNNEIISDIYLFNTTNHVINSDIEHGAGIEKYEFCENLSIRAKSDKIYYFTHYGNPMGNYADYYNVYLFDIKTCTSKFVYNTENENIKQWVYNSGMNNQIIYFAILLVDGFRIEIYNYIDNTRKIIYEFHGDKNNRQLTPCISISDNYITWITVKNDENYNNGIYDINLYDIEKDKLRILDHCFVNSPFTSVNLCGDHLSYVTRDGESTYFHNYDLSTNTENIVHINKLIDFYCVYANDDYLVWQEEEYKNIGGLNTASGRKGIYVYNYKNNELNYIDNKLKIYNDVAENEDYLVICGLYNNILLTYNIKCNIIIDLESKDITNLIEDFENLDIYSDTPSINYSWPFFVSDKKIGVSYFKYNNHVTDNYLIIYDIDK